MATEIPLLTASGRTSQPQMSKIRERRHHLCGDAEGDMRSTIVKTTMQKASWSAAEINVDPAQSHTGGGLDGKYSWSCGRTALEKRKVQPGIALANQRVVFTERNRMAIRIQEMMATCGDAILVVIKAVH